MSGGAERVTAKQSEGRLVKEPNPIGSWEAKPVRGRERRDDVSKKGE